MPITVDTLGEIKRDQTENSCLLFVNVLLSPSLYMLIQLFSLISVNSGFWNIHLHEHFACRWIFCSNSPWFQRIIVKCSQSYLSLLFKALLLHDTRNRRSFDGKTRRVWTGFYWFRFYCISYLCHVYKHFKLLLVVVAEKNEKGLVLFCISMYKT